MSTKFKKGDIVISLGNIGTKTVEITRWPRGTILTISENDCNCPNIEESKIGMNCINQECAELLSSIPLKNICVNTKTQEEWENVASDISFILSYDIDRILWLDGQYSSRKGEYIKNSDCFVISYEDWVKFFKKKESKPINTHPQWVQELKKGDIVECVYPYCNNVKQGCYTIFRDYEFDFPIYYKDGFCCSEPSDFQFWKLVKKANEPDTPIFPQVVLDYAKKHNLEIVKDNQRSCYNCAMNKNCNDRNFGCNSGTKMIDHVFKKKVVPQLSYAELQANWVKENNVKVGDTVTITHKPDDMQGWAGWVRNMGEYIGKSGIIKSIGKYNDRMSVSINGDTWLYPFQALKLVKEQPSTTPLPVDKIAVKIDSEEQWKFILNYYNLKSSWNYDEIARYYPGREPYFNRQRTGHFTELRLCHDDKLTILSFSEWLIQNNISYQGINLTIGTGGSFKEAPKDVSLDSIFRYPEKYENCYIAGVDLYDAVAMPPDASILDMLTNRGGELRYKWHIPDWRRPNINNNLEATIFEAPDDNEECNLIQVSI